MMVKIRIPRYASPARSLATTDVAPERNLRVSSTFHAALVDTSQDWIVRGTPAVTFTPRPEPREPGKRSLASLTKAWSWLRTKYNVTAVKRLRVTETVSLGEKRFVSIISVEGREFLIGGGASGVSLLAQLGPGGGFAEVGSMGARETAR